jgi:hypothetical protein
MFVAALPTASMAADSVEEIYHYVGEQRESSGSELITFFNFDPREDARINVEVIDLRGETGYQYTVPRASQLVLRTPDLGITDLYYIKVASSRPIAMSIVETYYSPTEAELGGVTPQPKLYSSYALANGSSGTSTDDFFRIYAPVTPTTIEFYDHSLTLLSTRTIEGNGLASFRGRDLGYDPYSGAFIRASDQTPNPFAISFMEGVPVAFLIIPQGIEENGDAQQVAIDFKTENKRNVINPRSMGRVWVAILSDSEFDAQQVDPMTVALGAGGAVPDKYVSKYSNRDGMLDLVLRFKTPEIGLQCGDTDVTLTGETYAGEDIIGTDRVVTVGCK